MAYVRYQSPNDPAFMVFDVTRFRVDHAIFLIPAASIRRLIAETLGGFRDFDLERMKLVQEKLRLDACLEWLEPWGDDDPTVLIPELKHEAGIDRVADYAIAAGEFARAYCPACEVEYLPGDVSRDPFDYEEEGMTVRGGRSMCSRGHTIHALIDSVDAEGLELPDEV